MFFGHSGIRNNLRFSFFQVAVYDRDGPRNDSENREMTQLMLGGIQLLCSWTSDVVETISWKLLHPTDHRTNSACPETAEEYERATKYNYQPSEKAALIEVCFFLRNCKILGIFKLYEVLVKFTLFLCKLKLELIVFPDYIDDQKRPAYAF